MTSIAAIAAALARPRVLSGTAGFNTKILSAPAATNCGGKYKVSINFLDGTNAPGLSSLQHIVNILAVVAVIASLLAGVGGVAYIGLGKVLGFYDSGRVGRVMIVGGVAGAFVVGLLATLINVALSYGLDNGC